MDSFGRGNSDRLAFRGAISQRYDRNFGGGAERDLTERDLYQLQSDGNNFQYPDSSRAGRDSVSYGTQAVGTQEKCHKELNFTTLSRFTTSLLSQYIEIQIEDVSPS